MTKILGYVTVRLPDPDAGAKIVRLTTKGRYAVTAMLDLAIQHSQGPINLAEISERQGISLSYLEQLFSKLRKEGLVSSARGPGGGYSLGHAAEDISIADVISAVDETVDATRCGGSKNCQGQKRCITHNLWEQLSIQIESFLLGISLADLVQQRELESDPNALEQPLVQMQI